MAAQTPPPGAASHAADASGGELPPELSELAADFDLEGEIGRGGTAVVYRARDRTLQRTVAIKVIRARFVGDSELVARLEREARLVARLDHPNLVALYSVRRLRHGSLALIMRLVEGRTLREAMVADGAFSVRLATRVLADTARALSAAHARGVVHRDVKPENIYLESATGRALLADFGAAAPLGDDARLTVAGMTIGTPGYLAPELIDGGDATPRSDLYALGLVGWEMLAGRAPWGGQSLFEILTFRKHSELPPVEELRDDVPGSLAEALAGALAREPARRWDSVDEFLLTMLSPGGVGVRRARRHAAPRAALPAAAPAVDIVATTVRFRRDLLAPPDAPLRDPDRVERGESIERGESVERATAALASLAASASGAAAPDRATPVLIPADDAARDAADDLDEDGYTDGRRPARRGRGRRVAALAGAGAMVVAAALLLAQLWLPGERARDLSGALAGGDTEARVEVPMLPPTVVPAAPSEEPVIPESLSGALAADSASAAARAADSAAQLAATPPAVVPPAPDAPADRGEAPRTASAERTPAAAPPAAPASPTGSPASSTATSRAASPAPTVAAAPPQRAPAPPVAGRSEGTRPAPAESVGGSRASAPARSGSGTFDAVRAMAVGGQHSCAVTGDGALWCWGSNGRGQLAASGGGARALRPTLVLEDAELRTVELGMTHSCALDTDGRALCWGNNANGQLGNGASTAREGPVRVAGGLQFTTLALGLAHSCALDTRGAAFCWGSNETGQLGNGRGGHRVTPTQVSAASRFSRLASGWHHSCAVSTGGQLLCWGANQYGQLGDGSTSTRSTPVLVTSASRFSAVAAGGQHSCGLTTTGTVFCWGRNHSGQLGDGTRADARVPRVADVGDAVVRLAAGSVHTCALTRGGDVYCWGQNSYGQLGDGTTEDRASPVAVAGAPAFVDLAAAGAHTCGRTAGGRIHCWGYNLDGQLGDGTRINRARPTPVRADR